MAEQFDFEDEWESEVDTLDGAQMRPGVADAQLKRHVLANNRMMLNPDGTPVIQEVPAQFRLEQAARQQKAREAAAKARPHRPQAQTPSELLGEEAPDAFDQELNNLAAERRTYEETVTEAEKRFDKAKYYKLILGQALFNDSSAAGQEVEQEIRNFAQERFEVFLGMRQERGAVPAIFEGWEPADFETLLIMIRRIRQKPELAAPPPGPKAEPTINVRGAPTSSSPASEPSLRPIGQGPAQARPIRQQQQRRNPTGPRKGQPRQRVTQPLVDKHTGQVRKDPVTGRVLEQDITPQVRPSAEAPQPVPLPPEGPALTALYAAKAAEGQRNLEQSLAKAGAVGMKLRIASTHAQLTGTDGEIVQEGEMYTPDPTMMVSTPGDLKAPNMADFRNR
jgi:hypothetical protein